MPYPGLSVPSTVTNPGCRLRFITNMKMPLWFETFSWPIALDQVVFGGRYMFEVPHRPFMAYAKFCGNDSF